MIFIAVTDPTAWLIKEWVLSGKITEMEARRVAASPLLLANAI
jgi:hypothetical protein